LPKVSDIQNFISSSSGKRNIIDVRSPGEFLQGHIPGATNIPLFNDEERAIIGTTYKQQSRQEAVIKGLEIVGPHLKNIVLKAQSVAGDNTVFVHCWRGGMRSGFVATLLEMYGLNVIVLKNGYKAFRNFALKSFEETKSILLLGGKTGSGKTLILKKLKEAGQQVIDLEGLAHHKGSAFGALGEKEQPSQEQFENELAMQLISMDPSVPLWLEDESRLIGKKVIPPGLWEQMRETKIIYLNLPFEIRLDYITKEYGKFPKDLLEVSVLKISKRLGPEQTKNAIIALNANDLKTTFGFCLHYYDKTYGYGLSQREKAKVEELFFETLNVEEITMELIKKITQAS